MGESRQLSVRLLTSSDRSYAHQEMTEVIVGPDRAKFFIYTHHLRERSTFFKKATSDTWSPNKKPIALLDTDSDIFNYYLGYIYSDESLDDYTTDQSVHIRGLVYMLADFLGDSKATNALIGEIKEDIRGEPFCPAWSVVKDMRSQVLVDSPLHKVMVDSYVCAPPLG